jgi:hypothetical protein
MHAPCAGIIDAVLDLVLDKTAADGKKEKHNAANLQKAIDENAQRKNQLLACGAAATERAAAPLQRSALPRGHSTGLAAPRGRCVNSSAKVVRDNVGGKRGLKRGEENLTSTQLAVKIIAIKDRLSNGAAHGLPCGADSFRRRDPCS